MQRLPLVVAQRLVVEIAQDVSRYVADHEPHDFFLDAALAVVDRIPDRLIERGRREARP